ncbi:hypothetical protein [Flavobacterium sp.]|uniref:hypothetical protein n=1 Tax=Flavobacterium sp. TaxID=239 RepID=UPI003753ACB9
MKNILKIKIVSLLSLLAICESCQNEDGNTDKFTNNQSVIARNYSDFLRSNKPEGSILIQSNGYGSNVIFTKNYSVSKKENILLTKNKINYSEIQLVNQNLNNYLSNVNKNHLSEKSNLTSFYGKKIEYLVKKNTGISSKSTDSIISTYIPNEIEVSFRSDSNSSLVSSELKVGTVVTWNVDSRNANGIAVLFDYNPVTQPDVRLAYNNPVAKKINIILPDTGGSYTITANDLATFPKDAVISCDVLRGNFSVSTNSQPLLLAITNVNNELVVKK